MAKLKHYQQFTSIQSTFTLDRNLINKKENGSGSAKPVQWMHLISFSHTKTYTVITSERRNINGQCFSLLIGHVLFHLQQITWIVRQTHYFLWMAASTMINSVLLYNVLLIRPSLDLGIQVNHVTLINSMKGGGVGVSLL